MIPVSYTFSAKVGPWQSAPYPNIEEVRALAEEKLREGCLRVDILLLIKGTDYLVEQVFGDPCHKITYNAITKSCEGVGEDTYEGPTFEGSLAWANRAVQMSRVIEVKIYLRVADRGHLIDIIVPE